MLETLCNEISKVLYFWFKIKTTLDLFSGSWLGSAIGYIRFYIYPLAAAAVLICAGVGLDVTGLFQGSSATVADAEVYEKALDAFVAMKKFAADFSESLSDLNSEGCTATQISIQALEVVRQINEMSLEAVDWLKYKNLQDLSDSVLAKTVEDLKNLVIAQVESEAPLGQTAQQALTDFVNNYPSNEPKKEFPMGTALLAVATLMVFMYLMNCVVSR